NVYREAFLTRRGASRLVFLRRGFAELHERLARYFQHRGGVLRRRALAEAVAIEGGRTTGVRYLQRAETREDIRRAKDAVEGFAEADAVVAAVPWNAVPALVPEPLRAQPPFAGLARLGGSPIVSVEMWLDRVVVDRPMAGLRDSEREWVFDKGSIFGRAGPPQRGAHQPGPGSVGPDVVAPLLPGDGQGPRRPLARPPRGGRDVRLRS